MSRPASAPPPPEIVALHSEGRHEEALHAIMRTLPVGPPNGSTEGVRGHIPMVWIRKVESKRARMRITSTYIVISVCEREREIAESNRRNEAAHTQKDPQKTTLPWQINGTSIIFGNETKHVFDLSVVHPCCVLCVCEFLPPSSRPASETSNRSQNHRLDSAERLCIYRAPAP